MLDELERIVNIGEWFVGVERPEDGRAFATLVDAAPVLIAIARAALAEREATDIPGLESAWEQMRVALEAWDTLEREAQG